MPAHRRVVGGLPWHGSCEERPLELMSQLLCNADRCGPPALTAAVLLRLLKREAFSGSEDCL